jgi:hypothetical protein
MKHDTQLNQVCARIAQAAATAVATVIAHQSFELIEDEVVVVAVVSVWFCCTLLVALVLAFNHGLSPGLPVSQHPPPPFMRSSISPVNDTAPPVFFGPALLLLY